MLPDKEALIFIFMGVASAQTSFPALKSKAFL